MNKTEKLQLDKMIKENDVEDCTNDIREKRHSQKIRDDVKKMLKLMKSSARLRRRSETEFDDLLVKNCQFLFNHYTDIYNKVKKEEINLGTLWQFLDVLKQIENGKLDQHEGSHKVGKLLKTLYLDSAVRKADKLNHERESGEEARPEPKNISWSEYKKKNLKKN
jgi:hypothetical protein